MPRRHQSIQFLQMSSVSHHNRKERVMMFPAWELVGLKPHSARCASQCLSRTGLCIPLGHLDVVLPDLISDMLMSYFRSCPAFGSRPGVVGVPSRTRSTPYPTSVRCKVILQRFQGTRPCCSIVRMANTAIFFALFLNVFHPRNQGGEMLNGRAATRNYGTPCSGSSPRKKRKR